MKKCCVRTLITLLVFIVLIAVGVIVLLNLTPAQLHVADISIGGTTLADNGLGDVKLIKLVQGARGLTKKESAVVNNPYKASDEDSRVQAYFAGSNFAEAASYRDLFDQSVVYDKRYKRTLYDTTLAYLLDKAMGEQYTLSDGSGKTTAMFTVREVTVSRSFVNEEQEVGNMRVVIGVPTSAFVGGLATIVDKVKVIKMPEHVYMVFDATFTVGTEDSAQGKIIFGDVTASIGGDKSNALNDVVFAKIAKTMQLSPAGEGAAGKTEVSNLVFEKAAAFINHLGAIGNAMTDISEVAVGTPKWGLIGVDVHKLNFIVTKE